MSGFGLGSEDGSLPVEFALHPAYPNPFNPSTMISFDVPELQNVSVQIFNITGQLIETLINGNIESGKHKVLWDAGNLPSGIYFVQLKSGDKTINQKLTLLK
jgi:flagellar hook assembly protein FlgD